MYYATGALGGYLLGAIPAMVVGAIIAYPMNHADLEGIRKAATVPMWITFYAFTPFWSFFCFRWVALKMLRQVPPPDD